MLPLSLWDLVRDAGTLVALAVILYKTVIRSSVRLPLPEGPLQPRWLGLIPVIATVLILAMHHAWLNDCSHRGCLTLIAAAAFVGFCALIAGHYRLGQRAPTSPWLVSMWLGWSILAVLTVYSAGTLAAVQDRMNEAYRKTPLTLHQIVDERAIVPPDAIYLPANLTAHFEGRMDDCHDRIAEMTFSPAIGTFDGGIYRAPSVVKEEKRVIITAKAKRYPDKRHAVIILRPDLAGITRTQYHWPNRQREKAIFDFIVISNQNAWVFGSEKVVTSASVPGTEPSTEVCSAIANLVTSHSLDAYVDIIAIGTASREGRHRDEDARAARRGHVLAEWVNFSLEHARKRKHVYVLNLGQYRPLPGERNPSTYEETAKERLVVLIGVVRRGEIDLKAALSDVFEQATLTDVFEQNPDHRFFSSLARHYLGREPQPHPGMPLSTACVRDPNTAVSEGAGAAVSPSRR